MLASKVSGDRKDTQPARDCSHRKLAVVISQEIAAHPLLWKLLALDFLNLDIVSVLLRNIRLDEYNQSNTMGMNIIINKSDIRYHLLNDKTEEELLLELGPTVSALVGI